MNVRLRLANVLFCLITVTTIGCGRLAVDTGASTVSECAEILREVRSATANNLTAPTGYSQRCPHLAVIEFAANATIDTDHWPKLLVPLSLRPESAITPEPCLNCTITRGPSIAEAINSLTTTTPLTDVVIDVLSKKGGRSASRAFFSLPVTVQERWIRKLTPEQLDRRLRSLVSARRTFALKRELPWAKDTLAQSDWNYWAGRTAFLAREYSDAVRLFGLPPSVNRARTQKMWLGRSFARIGKMDNAVKQWLALYDGNDGLACEARYRNALVLGYRSEWDQKQTSLKDALAVCNGIGWTNSIAWELWRSLLASQDWPGARQVFIDHKDSFEANRWLRGSEVPFWECYAPEKVEECILQVGDPYLPYIAVEPVTTTPEIQLIDSSASSLTDPNLDKLLVDLFEIGWDSLADQLLDTLYSIDPYSRYAEVYIDRLYATGDFFKAIKRVRHALPQTQQFSAVHRNHLYPLAFGQIIESNAMTHSIPVELPWAIMREESRFNPLAKSWVGALGLMQIMPDTAVKLGATRDQIDQLLTPEFNIKLGTKYLGKLMRRYDGDLMWSAAAYNAGEEAVDTWVERFGQLPRSVQMVLIPYGQTRRYAHKVLRSVLVYTDITQPTNSQHVATRVLH